MVNGMQPPGSGDVGGVDGQQRAQAAAKFPSLLDQSIYPQPLPDSGVSSSGVGAGHKHQESAGGGSMAAERRTTAAEAPELLCRRCDKASNTTILVRNYCSYSIVFLFSGRCGLLRWCR